MNSYLTEVFKLNTNRLANIGLINKLFLLLDGNVVGLDHLIANLRNHVVIKNRTLYVPRIFTWVN